MSRPGSSSSPNLTSLPYFHTNFRSSEEVKTFLSHHQNRPGSYILRPSFSKPNCVSVSVVLATGEIRHLNIHYDGTKYFLVPETKFDNIPALLKHHAVYPVHNEEQVTDVRFLYPITNSSRGGRRSTEPTLTLEGYQPLLATSRRTNGISRMHSNSMGHEESRGRSRSDFTGAGQNFDRRTHLSTRSEEGYRSEQIDGSLRVHRSPLDRLPTVPIQTGTISLSARPPVSLPANGTDLVPNYSFPDAPNVDKSAQLKAALREMEISGVCDCGFPVKESQLPDGWSIHQTPRDAKSPKRRLFFQDPNGDTFWEPPQEIALKFTEVHKKNIEILKEFCLTESSSNEAT